MSISSTEILSRLGSDSIIRVVRIASEALVQGVYFVLIVASTVIQCRTGLLRSPWKICILCITLLMFLMSTLFVATDIAYVIVGFKIIFNNSSFDVILDRLHQADIKTLSLIYTQEILLAFMLVLGDSVVLWRTWAIYYGKRIFMIIPVLTWLGSVVACLYELGCNVETHWAALSSDPSIASQGLPCAKSDLSVFTLSFANNVICICLVFYRAWSFRYSMRKYLGSARVDSQAEKILVLLTESGFLYLTIYILRAIQSYAGYSPGSQIAWDAVNSITLQGLGMYPTVIVILVELQKSLWDTDEISRELTQLEFAGPAGQQTSTMSNDVSFPRGQQQHVSSATYLA